MSMPRLAIPNGSVEGLKWLALVLMTGDHVNKYLLNGTMPALFDAGRLAMPIFAFVLAYNLARPGSLERGAYSRTMIRLVIFGALATPAFIALGGLVYGWWPLNVMFTLLIAAAVLSLLDKGQRRHLIAARAVFATGAVSLLGAAAVFMLGGSVVEYWWPALSISLAVWWYSKKPSVSAVLLLLAGLAGLCFINGNLWAFASLPLIAIAALLDLRVPRLRWAFYAYYPLHLAVIYLVRLQMMKTGYLFF